MKDFGAYNLGVTEAGQKKEKKGGTESSEQGNHGAKPAQVTEQASVTGSTSK